MKLTKMQQKNWALKTLLIMPHYSGVLQHFPKDKYPECKKTSGQLLLCF